MLKSIKVAELTQREHLRLSFLGKMFCWFIRGTKTTWVNLIFTEPIGRKNVGGYSWFASTSCILPFSALCPRKADHCALHSPGSCPLVSGWVGLMGNTDRGLESGGERGYTTHAAASLRCWRWPRSPAALCLLASPSSRAPALPGLLTPFHSFPHP